MFVKSREVKFNLIGGKVLSPPNIYWFSFSGLLIVVSLIALLTMGINWGIEFEGGYLVKLELDKPANVEDVRGILAEYADQALDKSIVQTSEEGKIVTLRMPYIEDPEIRKNTITEIKTTVDDRYGVAEVLEEEQVGSEWGREVSRKAIIALAVFLLVILLYITFRLEFKMAVPAILALVHDTFITVGIFALTRRQVNPATVIAFLTILGYSLYDTIVVFDRVDENSTLYAKSGKMAYADIVNESVNQTLIRSINTTLTTLIPIITILIFGGGTLKDFAFALFLGVLLGGYSSIFVACPLLALWKEREPRYAAIREKAQARGAREAILITSARGGIVEPEVDLEDELEMELEEEAMEEEAASVAVRKQKKPKPKPAASKLKPSGTKPKQTAPKATSKKPQQRKKATTKGPSGGKKKKKKKKKKR
ncbi:MAG: protein translocase subunit SecF [Actinomycetota bacterium]|nr:protein translocase subunit SecF [Actinomycetota bacterium]